MDLEQLRKLHEKALNGAAEDFEGDASSIVKMTAKEIEETIPAGIDKSKFTELITIVKDATKSNEEKAEAIRKISGLAEVAVNLLSKVI